MDSGSFTLILVIALLIVLSAYFSATETAFSSLNKVRIKNMASGGNKRARLVLALSEDYDRILSTLLIGNNIVNITAASLATIVFTFYFHDAGVTISTAAMTVLVLIFGEISPKSMAKEAPERFAMFAAPFLKVLTVLLYPLNILFMLWKRLLAKIFHIQEERGITEEELCTIVEEATQDGGLDASEGELIRSAIEFNDLDVEDVLTPRVDVVAVDEEDSREEILKTFQESGYSRLPVYRESIDNIIGVINFKDFYHHTDEPIEKLLKPAVYIAASIKISQLLKRLQGTKNHMVIVADDYGGTLGIVTLEDIIEELVGEIWDEHDEVVNEFEKLDDTAYRVMGSASLEKLFRLLDLSEEAESASVGGWVISEFGYIPHEGETKRIGDLSVTVTRADARRVLEITLRVLEPETADAAK